MSSHPAHPAVVHFPLAFFTTAYGIDLLRPALSLLPAALQELLPPGADLTRISYYALCAGLLTGIPAAVTGVLQAGSLMKKTGDMYLEDKKTLKPKVKFLFMHAGMNDAVILLSAGYWWMRRQAGGPTYEPAAWMVLLSVLLEGVLIFAASLGAKLVYNYGAGMAIAKDKKQQ
ncbi:hypothetical protein GQ53DRAFT_750559 [Thozetella sp. PMI_491]|nr:hypothetical protein GQ53DRAFT_750559 [Thozetella sp. PMI_491]